MIQILDTYGALVLFEEYASKHALASEKGNYKQANESYSIIASAVAFLRENNEILKLSGFLNHDSVGVRLWAATYLLPVLERDGVNVLSQIAGGTGIHSLTAETTLSEWKKGNLKL